MIIRKPLLIVTSAHRCPRMNVCPATAGLAIQCGGSLDADSHWFNAFCGATANFDSTLPHLIYPASPYFGAAGAFCMQGDKVFRAGQGVPQTGLYRVFHYQHRMPHEVMMKQGESFPACNKCGARVSFRLSSTAEPLALDRDFTEKAA